jgi:hypothetical protein
VAHKTVKQERAKLQMLQSEKSILETDINSAQVQLYLDRNDKMSTILQEIVRIQSNNTSLQITFIDSLPN